MAIQTQGDYDFTGSRNWTSPYVRYVPTRPKQQQLQKTNFRHEHRQWLPFICGPQCTGDGDIFTGRHTVYQDGGRFDPSKASLTHSSNSAQACWPINSFSVRKLSCYDRFKSVLAACLLRSLQHSMGQDGTHALELNYIITSSVQCRVFICPFKKQDILCYGAGIHPP